MIIESFQIISKYLIPIEWQKGCKPCSEILFCDDPRKLLLWASDLSSENQEKRLWSCAILRVLHTISHIEEVRRYSQVYNIHGQIIDHFKLFLSQGANDSLWLGKGKNKVQLSKIDWKLRKSRESIVIKLLHKKANIAETIHDLLGIRIVNYTIK